MLVLLHFYKLGYSPFTLAFLFLLYEAAGVLANLIGGWLATRYGIQRMLTVGLVTQITGFTLLSLLDPAWTAAMSVAWVVVAQGICGVAKDLTKTASKSAIKVTQAQAKAEDGGNNQLFKWVAWFTGSKNAMKGFGFFLGGVLLQALGFQHSLWAMAGLLVLVLAGVVLSVPPMMGKAKASKSAKELFAKNPASTAWPPHAWRCSARATCGSWSACRCSCIRRAGPSPWWADSWRPGPSATAWCRRWRRTS
jgi:MFS family permease